jgi:pimeloyl-ACP methyl ester carboxylesterase
MREGTVTLADGRRIGFAEYGVSNGVPVFEFHGFPGSRFYHLREDALEDAHVRLITLERPGIGLSDRKPARTLLDWPKDVAEVADHFGFDRFAVLGVSAGAPNAVACGYAMPDRVAIVGVICGVGPYFDNPQFDELHDDRFKLLLPLARVDFDTARSAVVDVMKPTSVAVNADAGAYFDDEYLSSTLDVDRPRFASERDQWIANLLATYVDPEATTDEVMSTFGPWGFTPRDLRVPVRAWHGELDDTPVEAIRLLVDEAPDGALVEYPGEGHYLKELHHEEWLAALTVWAR